MADQTTSIFKYLDINKSREATIDEALNNIKPFDKYYGLRKAREIKKIPYTITIPAYTYVPPNAIISDLIYQYNVSFVKDFRIVGLHGISDLETTVPGVLCVKYRIGSTVYRYALSTFSSSQAKASLQGLTFTPYTNQLIKKNFCLEYWRSAILDHGLTNSMLLTTSIFVNPATVEDLSVNTTLATPPLVVADLGLALPEVLPYNQVNLAFLDNV